MYKDKDKQREANAERQRRYRERQKGVTSEGVMQEGVTDKPVDVSARNTHLIPGYGGPDCVCIHCKQNHDPKVIINHGPLKSAVKLGCNEINRGGVACV